MLKLLLINKFFWKKGGSESVFFNEKSMLESSGHSVIPFSMLDERNEPSEYSKYFISGVDYSKTGLVDQLSAALKIIYSFEAKSKMKQLLGEHSPELAHFHIFQHQISPSVFGPLRKKGVPIVLTLHDLKPICPNYKMYTCHGVCEACMGGKFINCFKNRCTKDSALGSLVNTVEMYFHYAMKYYQNVDRYIAVSKFYRSKMIEFGFDEAKVDYLPNYIDASEYDPSTPEKGYILYFGRLSEEKGLAVLFEAARQLPEIPVYIVGTGPLEIELKQQAEKDGISNILFWGFKSGEELKKLLSESTAVVVPSEWYENCPMTVLEAFAAARPVIGSDIGGIPELIDDGVDGFIFSPGDVHSLQNKMKWIWEHRDASKEMGLTGRKKIEAQFNAEAHYDGLMSIYNDVIEKNG